MAMLQTVNRTDNDRLWVSATNGDASTLTSHFAVFKYNAASNTASVSTNEVGLAANATDAFVDAVGSFVGLADGNILTATVGNVQVYGYHESVNVMLIASSVTVRPGHPIAPGAVDASIGLSSVGYLYGGYFGPVTALDTITATLHSLGTQQTNFADHVFIRAM